MVANVEENDRAGVREARAVGGGDTLAIEMTVEACGEQSPPK